MNGFEFVFPVCAGKRGAAGPELTDVCGTAFSIGGGLFLTAAHVLENASSHSDWCIGYVADGHVRVGAIREEVSLTSLDMAVARSEVDSPKAAPWAARELAQLTDVFTAGYPYALDAVRGSLALRAFKGHVVASAVSDQFEASPRVYELSFQTPRGLSGAPLFLPGKPAMVTGVVVGNHSTEMTVFSSREVISESRETIVERFEAMHTGIAIQTSALLSIELAIFGGTLNDHLARHGLLANATAA